MNLLTRIIPLILVAALTGCAAPPVPPAVYIEQPVTTADVDTVVGEYEGQAAALATIHGRLSDACRAGRIPAPACTRLDILYQETRAAFVAKGDAYKAYLSDPTPANERRYRFQAADFANLYAQLRELAAAHGVEVPND